MFKVRQNRKAQTTLEYAVLIGVIVAGLIAMQIYLKRGWQGKLRESADNMGSQFTPGQTRIHKHIVQEPSQTHETTLVTGESNTALTTAQVQRKMSDSFETVGALDSDDMNFTRPGD